MLHSSYHMVGRSPVRLGGKRVHAVFMHTYELDCPANHSGSLYSSSIVLHHVVLVRPTCWPSSSFITEYTDDAFRQNLGKSCRLTVVVTLDVVFAYNSTERTRRQKAFYFLLVLRYFYFKIFGKTTKGDPLLLICQGVWNSMPPSAETTPVRNIIGNALGYRGPTVPYS